MDKSLTSADAGWAGRGVVGSAKLPAGALIKSERICFYEAELCFALLKMEDKKRPSPWAGLACCMLMVFTCRVNIIACLIHCPLLAGGICAVWHCKNIVVNAQPAHSEKSLCLIFVMIDW